MFTNFKHTAYFLAINILIVIYYKTYKSQEPLNFAYIQRYGDRLAMSSNASASQWLRNRFTSLYEAAPPPEEADFKALFVSIFSEDAQVWFNHEQISVDAFQEKITSANYAAKEASIDWKDLIEIPGNDAEHEGIVAGSFVVTRSMKFRIRAAPAQRLNHNIFSAKINIDPTAQPDITGSKRRISEFFLTSFDKAAPIHLQSIPQKEPATVDPSMLEKS
ncbi:hypothetical protein JR316_0002797 [Psilocybe cubensis]|uniref:Uncharacterized protein n=2 Tax=Psilocybe cubensis TaxID=181762 RepID=A0ACB8HDU8_PSICU|nr:hypothetical protein JR316_0002797 [Psilocybe cubensis]KAH9485882.1 hypothetical protein JR316_0002797 [Psilocybe cubensis]